MNLTGRSLIGSHPRTGEPATGHFEAGQPETENTSWQAIDPATGERFGPAFIDATADQVDDACALADAAALPYRRIPVEQRAAFLDACAAHIEGLGDELIETAHRESGLPIARLTGERGRTAGQLRMFADVVRSGEARRQRHSEALPDREPLPRPDLRLEMIPRGPVAVFGASNFPLAFSIAGGDTASALAAGCPVITKAHPAHPATCELVGRAVLAAAAETGMPDGVFSMLVGRSNDVGQRLVQDPRVTAVGFTGSRRGGLALVERAERRPVPVPVYAEMSSINPVVVLPGSISGERCTSLAKAYVASLVNGAGQFCTNPGLLLLPTGADGDAFLAATADAVGAEHGQTMLTSAIADAARDGAFSWQRTEGVTVVGEGVVGTGASAPAPIVVQCDAATFAAHPELTDEVFGAAGLVVRYAGLADADAVLAEVGGQLTATIQGSEQDIESARQLLPTLEGIAGRILWGGWPTGVEVDKSMVHGGPYPATSAPGTTSVGTLAIERWLRPICYQSMPDALLS